MGGSAPWMSGPQAVSQEPVQLATQSPVQLDEQVCWHPAPQASEQASMQVDVQPV